MRPSIALITKFQCGARGVRGARGAVFRDTQYGALPTNYPDPDPDPV